MVVIVLVLLVSMLAVAFDHMAEIRDTLPEDIIPDEWTFIPKVPLEEGDANFSCSTFELIGVTNTSYMRMQVLVNYSDGRWSYPQGQGEDYFGAVLPVMESEHATASQSTVVMVPGLPFNGTLPSFKDTISVRDLYGGEVSYRAEDSTFQVHQPFNRTLTLEFEVKRYNESALVGLGASSDPIFLAIPQDILAEVRGLALHAVGNETSPYLKALDIQRFLRNYHFTENRTDPQRRNVTEDALLGFLLGTSEGGSLYYATAFALMARSVDVPSRVVQGYLINATVPSQSVGCQDLHYYPEVWIDDAGWLIFDPTPLAGEGAQGERPEPIVDGEGDGNTTVWSIGGLVFDDLDGNGGLGLGELGVSGATVLLTSADGQLMATAVTNETGQYRFGGLTGSRYNVSVQPWGAGMHILPTTLPVPVDLDPEHPNATVDLGVTTVGDMGVIGTVFLDSDRDGMRETGEGPVAGALVLLKDQEGEVLQAAWSNDTGGYAFAPVDASSFLVEMVPGEGWRNTTPLLVPIGIAHRDDEPVDFGLFQNRIQGMVGEGCDCTGGQCNCTGVEGMAVGLYDEEGNLVDVTVTDDNGTYAFEGVPDGNYTVSILPDEGLVPIGNATVPVSCPGCAGANISFAVDHGNTTNMTGGGSGGLSISGMAWEDLDHDGVRNSTEAAIPGVLVSLFLENGNLWAERLTGPDGRYAFTGLRDGNLTVEFRTWDRWLETTPSVVEVDTNGSDIVDLDFGMYTYTVSGLVFEDIDRDRLQGLGENGLEGFGVALFDRTLPPITAAETNASGAFEIIGVLPGSYVIEVLLETGWRSSGSVSLQFDVISSDVSGLSFGVYGLSIEGSAYKDQDGDGALDAGEQPLPGAMILASTASGEVLRMVGTDAEGRFAFRAMAPGSYLVEALRSEEWVLTTASTALVQVGPERVSGLLFGYREWHRETNTTLDDVPVDAPKGEDFLVTGSSLDHYGEPLHGQSVVVYVSKDKDWRNGSFCGSGVVEEGRFAVVCNIPDSLELGAYQLIARTMGDEFHDPSTSDPEVFVRDRTDLIMESPSLGVVGKALLVEMVLLENATQSPVPNATVSLEGHDTVLTTDDRGRCRANLTFDAVGNHSVTAGFTGREFLGPSEATRTIAVFGIEAEILSSSLIRGSVTSLIGRLTAGPLNISEESFELVNENEVIWSGVTGEDGQFVAPIDIPAEAEIGSHDLTLKVGDYWDGELRITVAAGTDLTASSAQGRVWALLVDDRGHPLAGQAITMDLQGFNRTAITDTAGNASFLVDAGYKGQAKLVYEGTPLYAADSLALPVEGGPFDWLPIMLIAAVCAAGGGGAYILHRRMRRSKAEPATAVKAPSSNHGTTSYEISLPRIEPPFPPVWGQGEPLLIRLSGAGGTAQVLIDGRPEDEVDLASGRELERSFEKGPHLVRMEGAEGSRELAIRIVDYREEVVDLYNSWRGEWAKAAPGLTEDLGPREVEMLVRPLLDGGSHASLGEAVSIFERAEYSLHPIGRSEYERMYRACLEVSA